MANRLPVVLRWYFAETNSAQLLNGYFLLSDLLKCYRRYFDMTCTDPDSSRTPKIGVGLRSAAPGQLGGVVLASGVVGAFPNKSEQLILHCCSFWFLLTKTLSLSTDELSC